MDSQRTPRPPADLAAVQNAASVKPATQQAPFAVANNNNDNNGPLDGPPRFQQPQPQQFPGPRPGYGPGAGQRAPVPRHAFFVRPPQPGQGPPRFPPPRPPPAGYPPGPQGFPLGRPPFPPPGVDPRFLRPQQPPPQQLPLQQPPPPTLQQQQQAVLRRQTSLAGGRMAEQASSPELAAEQQSKDILSKTKADAELEQRDAQPTKQVNNVEEDVHSLTVADKEDRQTRAQSAAPALGEALSLEPAIASAPKAPAAERGVRSAGPTLLEASAQDRAQTAPAMMPSGDDSSIKGFDEGRRKSLTSPVASPVPSDPPARPVVLETSADATNASSAGPRTNGRATPVADASVVSEQARAEGANAAAPSPPRLMDNKEPRIVKKSPSGRAIKQDAENDSGVDESTQRREGPKSNGVSSRTPSKTRDADKRSAAGSPIKSPSKSIKSLPRTPDAAPPTADKKKVPMNKVQVGAAPSPNLKQVRSKIGSLENATHKPGGGKIKIENRKLDFSSAQPKIAAKNDKYTPSGGDKKIEQVKLQWNAKPKIGSLENATYKPGGGNKKIETVKLDFKDKAKSKVGSKENAKHVPGGGSVKSSATSPKTPQDTIVNIESQKLEFKAESKVGSMDNMKHRPGGGDKKIFDDKSYLRQSSSNVGSVSGSGSQSPIPMGATDNSCKNDLPSLDHGNFNEEP